MLTTKLYFPSMASFHTHKHSDAHTHSHSDARTHTHTQTRTHTHTHSLSLRCARAHMRMRTHSHIRWFPFISPHLDHIWLRAKRCANGGSDFWLSIKSVSNTLSCCCFVCAFIIGQLPQSPICTEEILLYTVHITSMIIIKFWFWS